LIYLHTIGDAERNAMAVLEKNSHMGEKAIEF
jgi:hypothetical protein